MQSISTHIAALLRVNDCVILPEWGAFLANRHPASIDQAQHKFTPPSKRVSINVKLRQNDGLLIHHIAGVESLDYAAANERVRAFVAELQKRLREKETVLLHGLGTLLLDTRGNVRFEPEATLEGDPTAFGLRAFHALPPSPSSVSEKAVVADVDSGVLVTRRNTRPWKYAVAGLIALPLLGYVGWLAAGSGVFQSEHPLQWADLNPFTEKVCITFKPRNAAPEFLEKKVTKPLVSLTEHPEAIAVNFTVNQKPGEYVDRQIWIESTARNANSTATTIEAIQEVAGPYHVIAGCFGEWKNAERLISELTSQGFAARLLDQHKGLYRVSAASVASRKVARKELQRTRAQINPGAWLLVQ